MVTFVALELLLGGLVGHVLLGRYTSISTGFLLQGVLNLSSYFLGGVLIGLVSPGLRIYEPAVGAFLAVAAMLAMTLFTPYTFMRMTQDKLVLGGLIAFALALVGARLGERLAGNRVD